METLSKKTLKNINKDRITVGSTEDFPEKVIQFGEGNFLRAFIDWMIDGLNINNKFGGKVAVVQPIPEGTVDALNQQDSLYTLLLRGIDDGEVVEKKQIITSISQGIDPYQKWEDFLNLAKLPELRIIVSNTTEAGITYLEESFPKTNCPNSFPAKLTALLYRRYTYYNGDQTKGLLIFPCELIENNGDNLKQIILDLASDWKLPTSFTAWINNHNHFFNTLVDRIVTGYPKDDYVEISEKLGYHDQLMDTGEIFHLWVIEGDEKFSRELPVKEEGFNVIWTDNLKAFRSRKVRVLNGSHTMMVPVGLLYGIESVREMVEHPKLGSFVKMGLFEEILPHIELPDSEKLSFANQVLDRFKNPFINHRLADISLNSSSKYKVRCLPTLLDTFNKNKSVAPAMAFSLSSLIALYNESDFTFKDDQTVLDFMNDLWKKYPGNKKEDLILLVEKVLANQELWEMDLNTITGLREMVSHYLYEIKTFGMEKTLDNFLV